MANQTSLTPNTFKESTIKWCNKKDISLEEISAHPYSVDVIAMLVWREEMWNKLNTSEQAVWGAYWNITYYKKRPIHKKALNKLEQITSTATSRNIDQITFTG